MALGVCPSEQGGGFMIGCSIIQSKPLPEGLAGPVYWHIDRFDSPERARSRWIGEHRIRRRRRRLETP